MRPLIPLMGLALIGCGSVVAGPGDEGGGGGASSTSSSTTTSSQGGGGQGGGQGGGWTECSTPEGYRICKGPANCDPSVCKGCADDLGDPQPISVCVSDKFVNDVGSYDWYLCPDGNVVVDLHYSQTYDTSSLWCIPFNLGVLFANAGYTDWVRYGDFSLFTGEPIPAPTSCPTIQGVPLCGGNCGGCPPDTVCTGRSPLHPYGICAPADDCSPAKKQWCDPGLGCFMWTVEPEAQDLVDLAGGYCYPLAICETMAAEVPGGGKCVVP